MSKALRYRMWSCKRLVWNNPSLWWIYLLNDRWFQMYMLSRICPRRLATECGHISASSETIPLWCVYLLNNHWFQMYMLSRICPRCLAIECGHKGASPETTPLWWIYLLNHHWFSDVYVIKNMSKALRYRMWSYKRHILNYPPLVDISVESSLIFRCICYQEYVQGA